MPIDNMDMDASAPVTCTFTPDELEVNVPERSSPGRGCSRPVWEDTDEPRCVWHADGATKPEKLAETVREGMLAGARVPESNFTSVSFPDDSVLVGADLSKTDLQDFKTQACTKPRSLVSHSRGT